MSVARVLLIDDEEVSADIVQMALDACGVRSELVWVSEVKAGIRAAEHNGPWSLVLIDVLFDVQLRGMEALQGVRSVFTGPAWMLTQLDLSDAERQVFIREGAVDVLLKWPQFDEFSAWLDERLQPPDGQGNTATSAECRSCSPAPWPLQGARSWVRG